MRHKFKLTLVTMKKLHIQSTAAQCRSVQALLSSACEIDVYIDKFLRVFILQVKKLGHYRFSDSWD